MNRRDRICFFLAQIKGGPLIAMNRICFGVNLFAQPISQMKACHLSCRCAESVFKEEITGEHWASK
jgi:hypothetical protein